MNNPLFQDNIGRDLPIQQAFATWLMKGIDELIPVTDELRIYLKRERRLRAGVCQGRMIDDVEKLLNKYHQSENGLTMGINSPFPVILIAFARENNQLSSWTAWTANWEYARINEQYFPFRTDHIEKRVQVAFFAHTPETAKALTSQMRLYCQQFRNNRFPVLWRFGGHEFELTASFNDLPMDVLADIPDRTNLTVFTWDFTIQAQIPYLKTPENPEYDENGRLKGFKTVKRVDVELYCKEQTRKFFETVTENE